MKHYLIKTLNGMAYGLFATLIVGVIIQQLGILISSELLSVNLYNLLASLMGMGIALGIGVVLKKDGLSLVMIGVVGAISTRFQLTNDFNITGVIGPGNPLTAYFVTIFSIIFLENALKKKTPIDIILVPLVSIFLGLILTIVFSLPLNFLVGLISSGLTIATEFVPIVMVVVISVSMGMILTAPISSAAVAIIIIDDTTLGGRIAAGAAVVGTSIQMIGFAIQARRDNKIGALISIGIGTSMLQFKNIVKKPIIWLPTIISSAIVAPIVYFLGFESTREGAGMGTSGLVGPLQSLSAMYETGKVWQFWVSLAIILIFGGILVYIFDKILYNKGVIKLGDLSLGEDL